MVMKTDQAEMTERDNGQTERPPRRPGKEHDPYYILAKSPPADMHNRALKHGDPFASFDRYGDVRPTGLQEEGIYHQGTRFLCCCVLGLGDERPLFLSSTVKEENDLLAGDLTNPDMAQGDGHVPRGTLHIARLK